MTSVYDVIVVGGGLSGLLVCRSIAKQGLNWKLLEARSLLGGRLKNDDDGKLIDLGGAWIWPKYQPLVASLVKELQLTTFVQPGDESSMRIVGGAVGFVRQISKDLDKDRIYLDSPVLKCTLEEHDNDRLIRVETQKESFLSRNVVLAAPPAVLSKRITFDPPLSKEKQDAMATCHTWMANVTKVALIYPERFWEDESNMGLGFAPGPAFQVYDSSTSDEVVKALTFFCLVPPFNKEALKDDGNLVRQVADQMCKAWAMLGRPDLSELVHSFTGHVCHRWPTEPYICEDDQPLTVHPHPTPSRALSQAEWGGCLHFAGSESDLSSPGVMEGAIGAVQRVVKELLASFNKS